MAESYRDEAGLKEFLVTTWAGYTGEGETLEKEVEQPDGSLVGVTIDGSWKMVDTYHVNPTKTVFNGREVIFKDDVPVWAASYHSVIPDEELSEPVLGFFYGQVAAHPDPDFPASAIDGTWDERFRFTRESLLLGELTVARFAIQEAIIDKQATHYPQAFRSNVIGGWIS